MGTKKGVFMRQVPELSLLSYVEGGATDKQKFVDNIIIGLKDYGFIILKDHTITADVIAKSYAAVEAFFKLPVETKLSYQSKEVGGQRGYTAFGTEHAKYTNVPDLKEFWHVGREVAENHPFAKYYPKNIWPTEIAGFKEVLSKLYGDLHQTSLYLLEAIAKGLDLPQDYFAKRVNEGNSILRPIHYPPVSKDAPPGAVRSAAHEDINLITILMGATSSGLELLDRDGKWLPVNTKEGQLVIDSGDMMERITNSVIPSTTHRVVNPENSSSTRFSMPYFVHPNPDVTLECIPSCLGSGAKYAPINSHEFLVQRLKEIGLINKK